MVRETALSPVDFIQPLLVRPGNGERNKRLCKVNPSKWFSSSPILNFVLDMST